MATVRREISTRATVEAVWDAIRDVGALHRRLVPRFVRDTVVEGDARIVTFANGLTVREPIVTIDDEARRLVWSSEGGITTHYNASVQAFAQGESTRVVWIADFLPDAARSRIEAAMDAGIAAMRGALEALAADEQMRLPM
jgi:DNA/RNA-binding domain of Phe-tRNA-synthetase-like protein